MAGERSWRSPHAAAQYAHHDYADFAQEFLRRNHDYCCDYRATIERINAAPETRVIEEEGLAGRWGLAAPFRSRGGPPI